MNCSPRTMIKVGLALAGVLTATYFALPQFREFVLASAPVLFALICPISMLAMMFMMKGGSGDQRACSTRDPQEAAPVPPKGAAAAAERAET